MVARTNRPRFGRSGATKAARNPQKTRQFAPTAQATPITRTLHSTQRCSRDRWRWVRQSRAPTAARMGSVAATKRSGAGSDVPCTAKMRPWQWAIRERESDCEATKCGRRELNPDPFRDKILSLACLPIPPRPRPTAVACAIRLLQPSSADSAQQPALSGRHVMHSAAPIGLSARERMGRAMVAIAVGSLIGTQYVQPPHQRSCFGAG